LEDRTKGEKVASPLTNPLREKKKSKGEIRQPKGGVLFAGKGEIQKNGYGTWGRA